MKKILLIFSTFALLLFSCENDHIEPGSKDTDIQPPGSPVNLLDDNLSFWYKWLGVPHHSVEGLPPGTPTGDGMHGEPLGLEDPKEVFSVVEMEGEKVLKVTGEIYGGLTTREEYENYYFKLDYKWGEKKWEPRLTEPRDLGIMYHCTGENEEGLWRVFMTGLECQISEQSSGDLFLIPDYFSSTWPLGKVRLGDDGEWNPAAPVKSVGGDENSVRVKRSQNYESPGNDWTTIELYTLGTTSIHLVNGNIVMVVEDTKLKSKNVTAPLKKGKIQLQSEGAEGYYRNVTIQPISEIPEEIRKAAGL
ncbi:DUF1080 domain-containing protein [soil metagenome]